MQGVFIAVIQHQLTNETWFKPKEATSLPQDLESHYKAICGGVSRKNFRGLHPQILLKTVHKITQSSHCFAFLFGLTSTQACLLPQQGQQGWGCPLWHLRVASVLCTETGRNRKLCPRNVREPDPLAFQTLQPWLLLLIVLICTMLVRYSFWIYFNRCPEGTCSRWQVRV